MKQKKNVVKGLLLLLALLTTVLSAVVLYRVMKRCRKEPYNALAKVKTVKAMRSLGFNPTSAIVPTFVPSGDPGGKWANPDDEQSCKAAFAQVDMVCQTNPMSDKIACSDYPMFYCDGQLRSSGDLDGGNCSYGAAVAYSAAECSNPRRASSNGGYLCGGSLDPCVAKAGTGILCTTPAPANPWGATNICYPN
jgi:hypothetical protein